MHSTHDSTQAADTAGAVVPGADAHTAPVGLDDVLDCIFTDYEDDPAAETAALDDLHARLAAAHRTTPRARRAHNRRMAGLRRGQSHRPEHGALGRDHRLTVLARRGRRSMAYRAALNLHSADPATRHRWTSTLAAHSKHRGRPAEAPPYEVPWAGVATYLANLVRDRAARAATTAENRGTWLDSLVHCLLSTVLAWLTATETPGPETSTDRPELTPPIPLPLRYVRTVLTAAPPAPAPPVPGARCAVLMAA